MVDPVDTFTQYAHLYTSLEAVQMGYWLNFLMSTAVKHGVKASQHGSGIHQCHTTLPEIRCKCGIHKIKHYPN
jgi:hypothetical protein